MPVEGGEIAGDVCVYVVVLILIIIVLYVALYLILVRRKEVRMFCDYCGETRIAISDCCNAPIKVKGIRYICRACGKDAEPICAVCRHRMGVKEYGRIGHGK
ncbi:MAG: hypothetical protein DRN20_01140 [Thermoplasmata archaeon]|nr:MAG: hypothetical protein DRN20_01140 [Thermoplasmata archaeon]